MADITKITLELTQDEAEQLAGVLGRVVGGTGMSVFLKLVHYGIQGDRYYNKVVFSPKEGED